VERGDRISSLPRGDKERATFSFWAGEYIPISKSRQEMKRIIALLVVFPLMGVFLAGCSTTRYGTYNPEAKHALYTLAGGTAGALVGAAFAASPGGAIVGALVADIYSVATIKYEHIRLEDREEAARRHKERLKAEEKRKEEKKVEEGIERQKKAEERKEPAKKAEEKKEQEKKAEEKKGIEQEKKAEEAKEPAKKAEERRVEVRKVSLFIEGSSVVTPTVRSGSTVEANVKYTLLAPVDDKQIKITETRILSSVEKRMELDRREVVRQQGTHLSTIRFTMPDDMPKGYCVLFTTISVGRYSKTAKAVIHII
jgi:outer membrane biosynthesis protein TonB